MIGNCKHGNMTGYCLDCCEEQIEKNKQESINYHSGYCDICENRHTLICDECNMDSFLFNPQDGKIKIDENGRQYIVIDKGDKIEIWWR